MPPHVVENIVEMVIVAISMLGFTGIVSWTVLRFRQPRPGGPASGELAEVSERLTRLEQAVDAVAVEVERGGEAQRFTARLLAERLGDGARPPTPEPAHGGESPALAAIAPPAAGDARDRR